MSTAYTTLRPFTRAFLGDYDASNLRYSNEAIDAQLSLTAMLGQGGLSLTVNAGSDGYEEDTTPLEKATACLLTAINMLAGVPEEFAYKTPILSVSRIGGVSNLFAHLNDLLDHLDGSPFAFEYDTDLKACVNEITRWMDSVTAAFDSDL